MARVFLHSVALDTAEVNDWQAGVYSLLKASVELDSIGVHRLVHTPEEADLIIFAEQAMQGVFQERVRHHPLFRRYREKCFIFDLTDHALPFLPGLYASLRKQDFSNGRTRTGYYMRIDENPFVTPTSFGNPTYLASFVGSLQNHPVRRGLAELGSENVFVEDTSTFALSRLMGNCSASERNHFWRHYADAIKNSEFSLCPRGVGAGSIRLFESMCIGRCPVIISDEWVLPHRVDWKSCSLPVAERDIPRIPELLLRHRAQAESLGQRAREEWERVFAPDVRFHWLVEDCLELLKSRTVPEAISGRLVWLKLLRYETARRFIATKRQMMREGPFLF